MPVVQTAEELWQDALPRVREQLGNGGARAWVEGTRPVAIVDDTVELAVPSAFAKEWLEARYAPMIVDALCTTAGRPIQLRVTVDGKGADDIGLLLEELEVEPPREAPRPSAPAPALNPRYLFETFVMGKSNSFAHAAAQAVAEQPARSYNPLFIYGGTGLGKTHLLHAIGHEVHRLTPHAVVRYVSSDQFMNEFIGGVREDRMPLFRRRYREADVLLVDDVQFLATGERTQEEFFHTFNALYNDMKQIVITSDRPPREIPKLEERLCTRFEWGLITDVLPPDLETRVAILQKKAAADGLQIPEEVLSYIAHRVHNNIRELEGRLIRVVAGGALSDRPITLELAQEVLQPLLPDGDAGEIPAEAIIAECIEYFQMPRNELIGPGRTRPQVLARQVAMYLCRELTPLSLPKIGATFGRDHTTVLHATEKIRGLMGERRQVYTQVQELTARIRKRVSVAR